MRHHIWSTYFTIKGIALACVIPFAPVTDYVTPHLPYMAGGSILAALLVFGLESWAHS